MRKQDRIHPQHDQRSSEQEDTQTQPRPSEQVKGGVHDQPAKPPRQPGKLPLPD